MNPLDFLDEDQLRVFFRRSKTEMSCMEKPHTFLNQLRDHKLILEERYKVRRDTPAMTAAMTQHI